MEGTYVSSKSLIELQTELKNLSGELEELYNVLSTAVNAANEQWQDGKYDEFVNEFRSSKETVIELSEKYKEWANSYLPPRIEKSIEYEKARTNIK